MAAPPDAGHTLSAPPPWVLSLVSQCDWQCRGTLPQLNRAWRGALAGSDAFWRRCAVDLASQRRLYITPHADNVSDWRALFLDLWGRRDMWEAPEEVELVETGADEAAGVVGEEGLAALAAGRRQFRFAIRVCARLRPLPSDADETAAERNAALVVLPFHQRLEMIKARQAGAMSSAAAARILMQEMGREPVDPWAKAELPEGSGGAAGEEAAADGDGKRDEGSPRSVLTGRDHKASILNVREGRGGGVLAVAPGCGLREFQFSHVLGADVKQGEVYAAAAAPLVADFLNGFNGTLLVYGQTGSGKTFTMFGPHAGGGDTCITGPARGVVPRAFEEVLGALAARRADGVLAELAVSYVEVFGQEVFDLLRGGQRVGQSRVAGQRYVLDGGCEAPVDSLQQLEELLHRGEAQKRRAATAMNERSTRAHAVVVLSLRQTDAVTRASHTSRLFLADLGGSEQLSKSRAAEGAVDAGTTSWAEYYEARERLVEATNINQGLFALKKCIDALNLRAPYVPYQDAKLTQLLSGALGGDSRTCVLVAGSLEAAHAGETVAALRFGERCAAVENAASLAGRGLAAALAALADEIDAAEAAVRAKERWEVVTRTRRDAHDGEETLRVSVMAGAEAERAQLERLLARRRQLLGEPEPAGHYAPPATL